MPVSPTFPGVYIEEIPSGVRTIVGVATSITAFVGRAVLGPVNDPTLINSFGDFEQQFGGLAVDLPMGYAVNDFFRNGGSQALIVRLVKNDGSAVRAKLTVGGLTLNAASAGSWANGQTATVNGVPTVISGLTASVDADNITDEIAARYGLTKGDLFNLSVSYMQNGRTAAQERYVNLTVHDDKGLSAAARARRVDRVLAQSSNLVEVPVDASGKPVLPGGSPASAAAPTGGGATPATGGGAAPTGGGAAPATGGGAAPTGGGTTPATGGGATPTGGGTTPATGGGAAPTGGGATPATGGGAAPTGGGAAPATGGGAAPTGGGAAPATGGGAAPTGGGAAPAGPAAPPAPIVASSGTDSGSLGDTDYIPADGESAKTGIYALEKADIFNLLCIPPDIPGGDTTPKVYQGALDYCYRLRRAMLIVDSPGKWSANPIGAAKSAANGLLDLGLTSDQARNAALYFPRVIESDILSNGQQATFVPCGIIAGIMATTDSTRGVWKAPAGMDAGLAGIVGLDVNLTNAENGTLNPLGINCLRTFKEAGPVVWGARTLRGADQLEDDYKYVPVRRFTLFLEESLYRGTQWVVFEPNADPLWAAIRLNVGAFMHNLFVQGAFQGQTPADAYFVKCDGTTTTQNDINLGVVNIVVGFAPLKPAEFVIIQIQQIAGNIAT